MVLNTVCTRLEDTVRSALAENGIAYTEVDVALDADSETVEVADATVIVPGGTDVWAWRMLSQSAGNTCPGNGK
ncbi:MAG: hypothetical protein ACLRZH_07245 [Ruthenibacterium lactatiformans]